MKYSAGDIVTLKRTMEDATVVKPIGNDMLEVEIAGIRFPVYLDEVETPYLNWFSKLKETKRKEQGRPTEIPPKQGHTSRESGYSLSFAPQFAFDGFADIADKFDVHFLNQSKHKVDFELECRLKGKTLFTCKENVAPLSSMPIRNLSFEEMSSGIQFLFQLHQTHNSDLSADMEVTVKIKPKTLFQHIQAIQKSKEETFLLPIAKGFPPKPPGQEQTPQKGVRRQMETKRGHKRVTPIREIDLHLEAILPEPKSMSNFEILTLQLATLERALDRAMEAKQQSMIIIHGVGAGKLKEEVHSILRSKSYVSFFQHDWMPRYGYGATEVFFH